MTELELVKKYQATILELEYNKQDIESFVIRAMPIISTRYGILVAQRFQEATDMQIHQIECSIRKVTEDYENPT